jgi:hypothetical protein
VNLVDSSGWLEVLLGGPNEAVFEPLLVERVALLVPALVVYEVTKKQDSFAVKVTPKLFCIFCSGEFSLK